MNTSHTFLPTTLLVLVFNVAYGSSIIKSSIKAGFPDTIDTYGLVSGLWTSVFAFGAFVGEWTQVFRFEVVLHLCAQVLPLAAFSLMLWLSAGPSSSLSLRSWSLCRCWSATSASSCADRAHQVHHLLLLRTQTRWHYWHHPQHNPLQNVVKQFLRSEYIEKKTSQFHFLHNVYRWETVNYVNMWVELNS